MREDITLEYYYKKAIYVSRITGHKVNINIKRVEEISHSFNGERKADTYIMSDRNVFYNEKELTNYSI